MNHNHIAVVGIGCHYPGAKDLKQLWENILSRRRQFRELPAERLPLTEYYDADRNVPDKTYGRHAAVLDGFKFDWARNRIPKTTYESSDIVHWLALEVATQALTDAGYSRENIPKTKTGVLLGNSLTGEFTRSNILRLRWPFVRKTLRAVGKNEGLSAELLDRLEKRMESVYKSVFPPVTEDSLAGWLSNTVAGRICNYYDLHGGGYVVDGACSSSLLAVATAAGKLANGELDLALAGGVDVSIDPMEIIGFAKTGALTSKDMNVYDRLSSGFIPGEGCGFVILKRLEDARRDGDYVYCVIRGWGISSDGKGGITAPTAKGQALALRRAYETAGYDPRTLDFIEGHGTGTVVGDRIELEGIALARDSFGSAEPRSCGVTSFKSIVGHTKAAAGIGGLIKAILSVNQRVLAPTAACKEPNEVFYSKAQSIYPILQGEIRQSNERLRAGVSAMGFGGINCHVTLESADLPKEELKPELEERAMLVSNQETEIFVFAADTRGELLAQVKQAHRLASGISVAELVDLASQLNQQVKAKAKFRAALVADHPDRLTDRLQFLIQKLESSFPVSGEVFVNSEKQVWIGNQVDRHRVGFLFPGQGSQKINMARTLVERFPWAREIAEQVWKVLPSGKETLFRPLERALNQEEIKKWEKQLSQTEIAQPTICLASVLWKKFLERLGIQPDLVAGHSLGELTALHVAGTYDEKTLFELAAIRGKAMAASEEEAGTMASLRCSHEEAEKILAEVSGYAVIANQNSPMQTVISGETGAVEEAIRIAQDRQIQAVRLPVSNAFHSKLVQQAAETLRQEAPLSDESVQLRVPFISGMDGEERKTLENAREYFAEQVIHPVHFVSLLSSLKDKCDLLVEVGPGRVLTGLVADYLQGELICYPVESRAGMDRDLHQFLAVYFVHGGEVNWHVLYENRFVRPFVPAEEKEFIVNPCENPLSVPAFSQTGDAAIRLPETEDLPAEVINQYLEQRGSFLLDIIRADLRHLNGMPSELVSKRPAKQKEPAVREQTPVEKSIYTPEKAIIRLAAERTGYPEDSITLNHRLLDDLNLDSIKSAELVSSVAQMFNIADQIDPSGFPNASLEEVVREMKPLIPDQVTKEVEGAKEEKDLAEQLIQQVVQMTGYPRETIHMDLRLLDDLNLDSIKSAELISSVAQMFDIADQIDPGSFPNASLEEIVRAMKPLLPEQTTEEAEGAKEEKDLAGQLIQQVVQITGYPRETIHMDLRLLDDLNLDSIKSAELVSNVAREFHLEGKLDPTAFANTTLKEIEQALSQLLSQQSKPLTAPLKPTVSLEPTPKRTKRSAPPTWVRNFVVDYVEEPLADHREIAFADTDQFLLVATQENHPLAMSLSKELNQLDVSSEMVTFTEVRDQAWWKDKAFSHMVVILPESDPDEEIPEIVARLQSVVQPVKEYGYQASITYIQYGGGYFGTRLDQIQLGTCTANAFASSLHMERPQAKIRVIDLSPALEPKAMVKNILLEITAEDAFLSVGYDEQNRRRVPQSMVQQPDTYVSRSIEWTNEDVILVTGGAKGITAECAFGVAKLTGVKMALVGSSSIEKSPEIQQTLARYQKEGLVCQYYSCDIGDRSAVEQLIAQVQTELGPITGVIHGAGRVYSKRAEQISHQAFLDEISPKVYGALHLCEALKEQPPKLIIGFTSLTGLTGMAGNSSYGFANEALQLILRRFEKEHPETQVLSIAYGVWDEVGMGMRSGSVRFLEKKGVYAIPVSEGVKRFVQLFQYDPQAKQVAISAKLDGLSTWHPRPVKREKKLRFVEEIITDYPEVELVTRAHLNLEKDSHMKDHIYNGTYLFPAVYGLEAMAQAVSYATGIEDFNLVRINDIQLKLPIALDPQKGVTIEIRVEVLEDKRIMAEIRSEQTGFAKTHFAATFVFPTEADVREDATSFPQEALAFDPKKDFYGPLMFQGPLYHCLEAVYDAEYDQEQQTGTALFAARVHYGEEFLLGDPYFHDSIMQSARLITPQDICLPVEISSFEKFGLYADMTGTWKGITRLKEKEDAYYTYTIEIVDENNQVVQSLTDFKVRIMEHDSILPTAEELTSLSYSDERHLNRVIEQQSQSLPIDVPELTIAHLPGIHQQEKELRHQRVERLFQRAIGKTGAKGDYSLTWNEAGKPLVLKQGEAARDLDISFSHDDEITICVVGSGEQGCDILPIEDHRTEEDWNHLLANKYTSLLQELRSQGDSLEEAGSRIWTCVEAVKKASQLGVQEITWQEVSDRTVILEATTEKATYQVLTLPVQLSVPVKRMIAVVVSAKERLQNQTVPEQTFGEFHPKHGFVYRFPLTFKDVPSLSRKVSLSNYAVWMGKVRELSLTTVLDRIVEQFATGKWGMVTNFIQTEVFGEIESHEVVEVHLQIDRIEDDSYIEIVCYWHKVMQNGDLELIATSRQGLTWVEIVGHGLVKISPFPPYFSQFLQEKLAVMGNKEHIQVENHTLSTELLGEELFTVKNDPVRRFLLQTGKFETSLEESNLVGNIYFSNYTTWQGRVRDQFFYQLAPELYRGTGEHGEWIALHSHIQHLREAMPFDTIEVQMSLLKRYQYGAKLLFEYYKLDADGQKQKLAFGEQDILWVKRDQQGNPIPAALPEAFEEKLKKVPAELLS